VWHHVRNAHAVENTYIKISTVLSITQFIIIAQGLPMQATKCTGILVVSKIHTTYSFNSISMPLWHPVFKQSRIDLHT